MAFTYDVSTARGQVRLIITDRDSVNPIFDDSEVDGFLALQGQSVFRAAATALETIAANEALVQKRIKMLDLETDGPAVARELRQSAVSLREQDEAANGGGFEVAEMIVNDFAWREKMLQC